MTRARRLAATAATATVAAALLTTSSADSSTTTVGQVFATEADTNCADSSWLQVGSEDASHAVPAAGVLTSFRALTGATPPGQMAFNVGRFDGATWRITATTDLLAAAAANDLIESDTRIRVRAGDVVGAYYVLPGNDCGRTAPPAAMYVGEDGHTPVGGALTDYSGGGFQLSVAATWEPDGDGDGYGDQTQDQCPTDPSTQKACRTSVPKTRIVKAQFEGHRVTIKFRANEKATFKCAVDSPKYRRCKSPLTLNLGSGKHTIGVVAKDPYGNVDPTPALRVVRIQ